MPPSKYVRKLWYWGWVFNLKAYLAQWLICNPPSVRLAGEGTLSETHAKCPGRTTGHRQNTDNFLLWNYDAWDQQIRQWTTLDQNYPCALHVWILWHKTRGPKTCYHFCKIADGEKLYFPFMLVAQCLCDKRVLVDICHIITPKLL